MVDFIHNLRSHLPRIWEGARDAAIDMVTDRKVWATFGTVTVAGPILMKQSRFPLVQRMTYAVFTRGMRWFYWGGFGLSATLTVKSAADDDDYGVGRNLVLGGSILVTKQLGDRYMSPFLRVVGEGMIHAASRVPANIGAWLHLHGAAMSGISADSSAASGLALVAHAFDEIAAAFVAGKPVMGALGKFWGETAEMRGIAPTVVRNLEWGGMSLAKPLTAVIPGVRLVNGMQWMCIIPQ